MMNTRMVLFSRSFPQETVAKRQGYKQSFGNGTVSGFEAKRQNASKGGESAVQETAVAQLPGLATFRFELPRCQWLRGLDNYHVYVKKLTAAKLAAGWEQGAPLHPADDARVGFWILTTVCRGLPEDAVEDCGTGSEMEDALARVFDPASYWNAQERRSGVRHASLTKFRWDVWQEWSSFEYAGGDPSLFSHQWNRKLRKIEEVGHEQFPSAAMAAATYLFAIKCSAAECHNGCRDMLLWVGEDERLGYLQQSLEEWHVWDVELRHDESTTNREGRRANASKDRAKRQCWNCDKLGFRGKGVKE